MTPEKGRRTAVDPWASYWPTDVTNAEDCPQALVWIDNKCDWSEALRVGYSRIHIGLAPQGEGRDLRYVPVCVDVPASYGLLARQMISDLLAARAAHTVMEVARLVQGELTSECCQLS
jgi:hypothetical protein